MVPTEFLLGAAIITAAPQYQVSRLSTICLAVPLSLTLGDPTARSACCRAGAIVARHERRQGRGSPSGTSGHQRCVRRRRRRSRGTVAPAAGDLGLAQPLLQAQRREDERKQAAAVAGWRLGQTWAPAGLHGAVWLRCYRGSRAASDESSPSATELEPCCLRAMS